MNVQGIGILAALALGLAVPAGIAQGQDSQKTGSNTQRTTSSSAATRGQDQQGRDQQRQKNQQDQQDQQDMSWQVEPVGWVRTAYDFDQDGTYDAVEYLFAYDLEKARQDSRVRGGSMRDGGSLPSSRSVQDGDTMEAGSQRSSFRAPRYAVADDGSTARVHGRVLDVRTVRLQGMQQPHTVATLRTQSGKTVLVDLGDPDTSQADVQSGDSITAQGRKVRYNGIATLFANRVRTNGETTTIGRPTNASFRSSSGEQRWSRRGSGQQAFQGSSSTSGQGRSAWNGGDRQPLYRLQGDVVGTHTADVVGDSQDHVLALLRLKDGRTRMVDLGSEDQLQDAMPSEGETISVLACPCRIEGKKAYAAKQVRAGGETISIERSAPVGNLMLQGEDFQDAKQKARDSGS